MDNLLLRLIINLDPLDHALYKGIRFDVTNGTTNLL